MKFRKEERIEVGRQIYESGLSNLKAAEQLGISEESARRYRILYEEAYGLEHDSSKQHKGNVGTKITYVPQSTSSRSEDYSSMSKEELIEELMQARIRESRLKKGYMVKGVGADKEYILLDSKNTK
ncbi:MAG: hypothetical protein KBS56_05835 [Clostridiales bacterium]|nr:hypothetical protein [Candidatus Crickella equi]